MERVSASDGPLMRHLCPLMRHLWATCATKRRAKSVPCRGKFWNLARFLTSKQTLLALLDVAKLSQPTHASRATTSNQGEKADEDDSTRDRNQSRDQVGLGRFGNRAVGTLEPSVANAHAARVASAMH
eukprot:6790811-Prymnesium_polylepis.1